MLQAIGMGLMGAGTLAGMWGANQQYKAQRQQQGQLNRRIDQNTWTGQTPYEKMIMGMMGNGALNAQTYNPMMIDPNAQGFNTGQDALAQMLRADPYKAAQGTINAMAPLDQRMMSDSLSQLRAGAGSIGARFGSAMNGRSADLMLQMSQGFGARNAGLMQQGYESAQGRNLQAALGMNQFLGQFALANQGAANQAGMYNADSRARSQQMRMQAAQMGFGMQAGQRQHNAGLLGLMAGQQVPQNPWGAIGQGLQDLGGTAMMYPILQQMLRQPYSAGNVANARY